MFISLCHCHVESKNGRIPPMEHWQRIADNLRNAGFSWGCSSKRDSTGRVFFTADAYARDGRRFTVLADDRLTAFVELHTAIQRQLEARIKYWEIIADNLRNAGCRCGSISSTGKDGRQFWVVAAERDAGRFIVQAHEKLTGFLELEAAIHSATKMAYEIERSNSNVSERSSSRANRNRAAVRLSRHRAVPIRWK
jgi:hypothetical protein